MSKTETFELVKFESGLGEEKQNAIATRYNQVTGNLSDLVDAAKSIEIRDASDRSGMQAAREARLALRKIRTGVESVRKELKEDALREGKAIDGMANVIKYLIEPVERDLQEKEDYAKRIEQDRIDRIASERSAALSAFGIDASHFDLGAMPESAYEELRRTSEAGYNARIKEEERERQRIEEQRKAEAKAEAERQEAARIESEKLRAENERLREAARAAELKRAEAEEAANAERKKADDERRKLEKAADDARKKAEADRAKAEAEAAKERERIRAEELRKAEEEKARARAERDAEQARLAAPDKEKIAAFVADLCKTTIPNVSSDSALALFARVRSALNEIVTDCRKTAKDMEGCE